LALHLWKKKTSKAESLFKTRFLHVEEEFFNFSLALGKICAYIRICRRVPKPQEKNPPAERGAAGNFRLGREILARREQTARPQERI